MPKAGGLGQSIGQSIRQMPIIADPGSVLRRGEGGILPERGSRSQRDTVLALLGGGMQSVGQSGSPLLAALTPLLAGAVGTRTEGLFNTAQAGRDQAAIDRLLGAMGGGYTAAPMPSAPGAAPVAGGAGSDVLAGSDGADMLGAAPPAQPAPEGWSQIQQGIFRGESGGDYDALFNYQNRPGGQFEGVRLTDMTVDQALQFASPSGPYAGYVRGQVGRTATPMGAYQIVGTTLRGAKEGLGLTGNERMTPELQDQIGQWIYRTQGAGAWEGYSPGGGPITGGGGTTTMRGDGGGNGFGGPGMSRALLELMVDPNISPELRNLAGSLAGQSQGRVAPVDPIQAERDRIALQMDQVRLADMLAPEPPADAMSPDMIRQINVAIESITTAIRSLELQGLTREEAEAQIRADPLYSRQWELVQAGQTAAPGAAPAAPAAATPRTTPPPPPPGTVPY
jgi:hypothetical protein